MQNVPFHQTRTRSQQIAQWAILLLSAVLIFGLASQGFATVETTLGNIQSKMISTILPLVAIIGFAWAGLSFVLGNPNARTHLVLAIAGAIIGFAAPSIVVFLRGLVN